MAVASLTLTPLSVHAQATVGGTVLEATTRTPVEGVRVVVEGTPRGAMTDNRGRFVLTGLTGTDVNLRVNRIGFRELRALADRLRGRHCSMGMSEDLEVAVASGSTMVRVGTAVFGRRPPPLDPPK